MKRNRLAFLSFGFAALFLLLGILSFWYLHKKADFVSNDVETKESGALHVFLFANYSDYFVYRGMPLGFQYEMLKILSDSLHLPLKIDVECDYFNIVNERDNKNYDIVAMELPSSELLNSLICKSLPFDTTYPVMVAKRYPRPQANSSLILYVPANFSGNIVCDSLSSSVDWQVERSNYATVEELFEWLDNDRIDYIASDYHTAALLLQFYPELDIIKQVGPAYPRQWILKSDNDSLNLRINNWLNEFVNSRKYKFLCRKYFSQQSKIQNVPQTKIKSRHISQYDKIVKKYASAAGIDWRFVLSVMYQESKFISGLYGLGGSFGLMQMMPVTCEHYGIDENSSEEEQIRAGVNHIKSISRFFDNVEDDNEKYKFVAASYNSGPGHVQDAQRLCAKYGDNPLLWDDVSKYLIMKSEREYYSDPVVKCGYYPGKHSVTYAQQVIDRYDSYCLLFK